MRKNMLKRLMVLGVSAMAVLSNNTVFASEHRHYDDNYDHYCDSEKTCGMKLSEHSGGKATCKEQAICDYCGKPYGDVNRSNHTGDTEVRNARETGPCSMTSGGYTGDTYCKGCDSLLIKGTAIEPIHEDANKDHYCDSEKACGRKLSEHSGGTATCKDQAICDYCGKPYGDVNRSNHAGDTEVRNAKAAACTEDGYTGDTYCKGCETKILDGTSIPAGHTDANKDHICDAETCKATISSHSGGTATCKAQAICDYCGKTYGDIDKSNHAGDTELRDRKPAACTEDGYTGDTYCKTCGVELQKGEAVTAPGYHEDTDNDHICNRTFYDNGIEYPCNTVVSDHSGGTATCKDQAVCDICGNPYGETDFTNHTGGTELRDRKPATDTEDGYTGDTYCVSCNTKLLDGTVIQAIGHPDSENKKESDTGQSVKNEIEEKKVPKTGDHTPVVTLCSLFLSSIAIIFACLMREKLYRRNGKGA